ncbi:glycosyltransferase family 4 protein [Leptospira idonii]|uniref:Glycosyltransferase n=1 Tax=Leptospira idonii TaxID=1193500 RepID=A0A4R9LVS9_9LEPT|nr:glycosyltransferase family 4 protein [Leptospira idonii]TGN17123.1 glycosyltransferase [Leptospira idonii]
MPAPSEKKKIAIVIPRFHPDVAGGAEKLAKDYAEILKEHYDITIFTSCAKDYTTWKTELKPGTEEWEGLRIRRFPVLQTRSMNNMNQILELCLKQGKDVPIGLEDYFLQEQGPYLPDLVNTVLEEENKFDLFLLVGYLYYPIVKLLPKLKKPVLIIPTFHDEPPLRLPVYERTFLPKYSYSFNAPEEAEVYKNRMGTLPTNYAYIGTYVPMPDLAKTETEEDSESVSLLTLGRIEPAKGFGELFRQYDEWRKFYPSENIFLSCIGNKHLPDSLIPSSVHLKGFVEQKEKEKLLNDCYLVLNPSPLESFSIAMMEAWSYGKPVLVNGKSDVMRGHCERSQGGLYYSDEISFRRSLEYLLEHKEVGQRLGNNGKNYVKANFTKEIVTNKLLGVVSKLLD